MILLRPLRSPQGPTRPQYYLTLIALWLFTILWGFTIYYIWFKFDLSLWQKLLLELAAVLICPDIETLFEGYDKYMRERKTAQVSHEESESELG